MTTKPVQYYPDYKPEDPEAFERMGKMMRAAETPEELRTVSVMFIMDMSYPRQDIATMLGRVEREKGWKGKLA